MLPGEWKPILTALVLPPAGPLLLVLLGLIVARRWRRAGSGLAVLAVATLWALSCHGFGVLLEGWLLPRAAAVQPAQLATVQAIVVLGGGIEREAPEYGLPQPSPATLARLRYGAWLAHRTGKPLAFAGGIGWAAVDGGIAPEGEVARQVLAQDFGVVPRWIDGDSRDTRENAVRTRRLLAAAHVDRIALVTNTWHMPRAVREFERAGFRVLPAPTGFPVPKTRPLLEWLPSGDGLELSRMVLREALAAAVAP